MSRVSAPWELGSFFNFEPTVFEGHDWLPENAVLFGSGRDALRAAISQGLSRGWRRLYVPTYYCHDVTDAIAEDIEVCLYPHQPFSNTTAHMTLADDEAIIVVEYFGLKATLEVVGGSVLLDRTHDVIAQWNYQRTPNYVFASLRKFLPLSDGGVLWSPLCQDAPEPPAVTGTHALAAGKLAAAMVLKSAYLDGAGVEKEGFLALAAEGEAAIGIGTEVSGPTVLSALLIPRADISRLREQRMQNLSLLDAGLMGKSLCFSWHCTPAYGVLIFLDSISCNNFRSYLIARNIYPAILWPAFDKYSTADDADLSARMLVVHADARYGMADMVSVLEVLVAAGENRGQES